MSHSKSMPHRVMMESESEGVLELVHIDKRIVPITYRIVQECQEFFLEANGC